MIGAAATAAFAKQFQALTESAPMMWQRRLSKRLIVAGLPHAQDIPTACDIPTGLGETSDTIISQLARSHEANGPGGSIDPLHKPVSIAELTMEKEATAVLMAVSSRKDLNDISGDVRDEILTVTEVAGLLTPKLGEKIVHGRARTKGLR